MHIHSEEELSEVLNQIEINKKEIKRVENTSNTSLILTIILVILLIFIYNSSEFMGKFFSFIFIILMIFIAIFILVGKNATVKAYLDYIEIANVACSEYKAKVKQEEKMLSQIIFDEEFKVAGVSFRPDELNRAIKYLVDISYFEPYFGYSNKEIEEDGLTVYKYETVQTNQFSLEVEPDNEYDEDAISVKINGEVVGYVPQGINKRIYPYILNPQNYNITKYIRIVGGPYKEFNYLEDKVKIIKNTKYGFRVRLIIQDESI